LRSRQNDLFELIAVVEKATFGLPAIARIVAVD
jgi:hypothetical protein